LLSRLNGKVRYVLLRLQLEHPSWGPKILRMKLGQWPSLKGLRLLSEASIGRYLHQWPRFRRGKRTQKQDERPNQPTHVHQRWRIDFKLGIVLAGKTQANLHTVRDPVG
jgi:hypothetical protein